MGGLGEITAAVDTGPLGWAVALHAVIVPLRLLPRAVVRMQAAAVFAGGVPKLEGVWADCIPHTQEVLDGMCSTLSFWQKTVG